MKNFLLEILCEEIPADLQETAAINLLNIFKKISKDKGIEVSSSCTSMQDPLSEMNNTKENVNKINNTNGELEKSPVRDFSAAILSRVSSKLNDESIGSLSTIHSASAIGRDAEYSTSRAHTSFYDNTNTNNYFYSPRRITLNLELSCSELNQSEIIRGPRVGIQNEILEKFLKKYDFKKEHLIEIEHNKIKYHAIKIEEILNSNEDGILQNLANICLESLKQLTWPRTMTWKANGEKWIRPIRNIMALFNNKIINFEFAGVQTSNFTFGHKILTNNVKIEINNIDEYQEKLREKNVIVDKEKRRGIIINNILFTTKLSSSDERRECGGSTENNSNSLDNNINKDGFRSLRGLQPPSNSYVAALESSSLVSLGQASPGMTATFLEKNNHTYNTKLLKTLVNIIEFPNILECKIPDEFMSLPHKLIEYVMIYHQKYIPLHDSDNTLLDKFLVVIDHNNPNDTMRNGYEKVLNARLSDAKFFWDKFCNTKIEDLIENLKLSQSEYIPEMNILEFNKYINKQLLEIYNYDIDLNILSCDLGSDIYSEYPALRGFLSSPYLKQHNYPKEISDIAKEIYYGESELYERDQIPQNKISQTIVALKYQAKLKYYLIDKGEKPTTSRDPFALKRAIKMVYDLDEKLLDIFNENDFVRNVVENYKK